MNSTHPVYTAEITVVVIFNQWETLDTLLLKLTPALLITYKIHTWTIIDLINILTSMILIATIFFKY